MRGLLVLVKLIDRDRPETRVIPIRILELMKEEQSIFEPRFDSSESKFRETDYKGVVLIFKEGQIRFSSMVDFVATKGLHISNRPSQTEFRMMPSERWSEIGKPIKWDTFCSNLIDMILDEKDVITTVWGKEYDRVLPKG